jgi:hypothetical protein
MTGFFSWLRRSVRDAVLGGFADAAEVLHEAEDVPALLLEHRQAAPEGEAGPEALPAPKRNGKVRA